jgi:hypothetical protein
MKDALVDDQGNPTDGRLRSVTVPPPNKFGIIVIIHEPQYEPLEKDVIDGLLKIVEEIEPLYQEELKRPVDLNKVPTTICFRVP